MKAKRYCLIIVFLFAILFSYIPKAARAEKIWPGGPDINGDSAIVVELNSGLILYEKNAYTAQYPASITKIMTALLAIENCSLDETMTMSRLAEDNVYGARIGLVRGEQVTMRDALYGILLESANEVAYGIAEHVSGSTMKAFVTMMNKRASELGCVNTNFTNPHGLHEEKHYTCAYDMALIGAAAIKNETYRKISGTRTYTIPATNKNVARPLANHHAFIRKTLNYKYAIAGQPGETKEAKFTLVTFAEKDDKLIVCVVLHAETSADVYNDTIKLCDFALNNFTVYNPAVEMLSDSSTLFSTLFSSTPSFVSEGNSMLSLANGSRIILPSIASFGDAEKELVLYDDVKIVHGENVVGKLNFSYAGKYVGSDAIIFYNDEYPLNNSLFEERWPDFLVLPSTAFSYDYQRALKASLSLAEPIITESPDAQEEKPELKEFIADFYYTYKTAIVVSIAVGIIVLTVGIYVIFVEMPYRADKKDRLNLR